MLRVIAAAALAVLLALVAIWVNGGFSDLLAWAIRQQRAFQNTIALSLRAVRSGDNAAIFALVAACFAYGLAHAAGPGHGKVLIGGYGFARKVPMLRLSVVALAASLGQAITAIGLVYMGVLILNLTRQTMVGVTEQFFAPVSYSAIAAIGLWLVWRGGRRLREKTHSDHAEVCSSCGHAHGPTLQQVHQVGSLREAMALIIGIAIRPCTGALFVLITTWQMGIAVIGILGTFAMALGTAIITIGVGLAATGLRGGLLADVMGSPRGAQIAAGVEIVAGCVVALLAGGLLFRAI
jgi:ABC-type nickel/cobalt efflux system permease component RcnA